MDDVQRHLVFIAVRDWKARKSQIAKEIPLLTEKDKKERTPYEQKLLVLSRLRKRTHASKQAANEQIEWVLEAEQLKRLRQIILQWKFWETGLPGLANNPEVVRGLGLSAKQRKQIYNVESSLTKPVPPSFIVAKGEEGKDAVDLLTPWFEYLRLRVVDRNNKAFALLTSSQRAKWAQMFGKPFQDKRYEKYQKKRQELVAKRGKNAGAE